ncbi:hypothetical protein pb186bvf_008231 [Paramecium bursaria]
MHLEAYRTLLQKVRGFENQENHQELKKAKSVGKIQNGTVNKHLEIDEPDFVSRMNDLRAQSEHIYIDSMSRDTSQNKEMLNQIDFIRDQVETVKNSLRICDSISSDRFRNKNFSQFSLLSSKTLDTLQKKAYSIQKIKQNLSPIQSQLQSQALTPKSTPKKPFQYQNEFTTKKSTECIRPTQKKLNPHSKRQNDTNYLFCMFTKLSNSNVIQLMDRQKIILKDKKSGQNPILYNLKNPLLSNQSDVQKIISSNPDQNIFLLLGGKSTSKRKIMNSIIEQLIGKHEYASEIQVFASYAINGMLSQTNNAYQLLPYTLKSSQVQLYQMEQVSSSTEDLLDAISNFIKESFNDPYYQIKKYMHEQLLMTQSGQLRKTIMKLIQKDLTSIKVLQLNLKVDLRPYHNHQQFSQLKWLDWQHSIRWAGYQISTQSIGIIGQLSKNFLYKSIEIPSRRHLNCIEIIQIINQMSDQVCEETHQLYKQIICETIQKLKQKSERGSLQMSEAEIQQFRDIWEKKLDHLRNPKGVAPKLTKQENSENTEKIEKKIKLDENDVKEEDGQEIKEENQSDKLEFESEQEPEEVKEVKTEKPSNKSVIKQQPKEFTLFDKVRELENIRKEKELESQTNDSDIDNPKNYDMQIFAQKINGDNNALHRIKPNKQQKAILETILIADHINHKDCFYPNTNLTFTFKVEK